jgi:cytochrome c oxidase cbb3-type subunit 2
MSHEKLETNIGWMAILVVVVISFGGLAEIVPLMHQAEAIEPLPGVKPYPALQLAGRDIYVREGCYNCHSQMVRTLRFETERYGHYSLAGESVYDRPFQWGSKRTGPDLARVGGRYSDDWHRVHLLNPRDVVPESNMPSFPWLGTAQVDGAQITANVQFVDPVTAAQIMAPRSLVILQSGDPIVLECDDADGDSIKRIDVGNTAQASKTYFSSTGAIGGADEGFINLGSVSASRAAGFTSFAYTGTDQFETVLTGDFSAFNQAGANVFLSSAND